MKRILVWLLFTAPLSAETLIYDHKVGMFVLTEAACSESFEGAEMFRAGVFYASSVGQAAQICWRKDGNTIILRLFDQVKEMPAGAFRVFK